MNCNKEHNELSDIELKIIYYIYHSGPAFTKKLATRVHNNIQVINECIKNLQHTGYLERVSGTLIDYRINKRNKVTKHRNHTYYDLTRKGRLFMRQFKGKVEVNLRPPFKQV
jgi:predicted transcriptional regulator